MREIRENPPRFIITEGQLRYFYELLDALEENKVPLQTQDAFALGTMALNYDAIDEAQRSISDDGMMMEVQGDRNRISKANPAISVLKDAQANVRFYIDKFNMTPQSRGKVLGGGLGGINSKKDDDDFNSV